MTADDMLISDSSSDGCSSDLYDPPTDLVPVVQIATVPNVLVVPPELPIKNFADFLKYAKSKKSLNYGSTGVGTSSQLSSFLLMQEIGAKDATHVTYNGAEAINALIAGRLEFMFATTPPENGTP